MLNFCIPTMVQSSLYGRRYALLSRKTDSHKDVYDIYSLHKLMDPLSHLSLRRKSRIVSVLPTILLSKKVFIFVADLYSWERVGSANRKGHCSTPFYAWRYSYIEEQLATNQFTMAISGGEKDHEKALCEYWYPRNAIESGMMYRDFLRTQFRSAGTPRPRNG